MVLAIPIHVLAVSLKWCTDVTISTHFRNPPKNMHDIWPSPNGCTCLGLARTIHIYGLFTVYMAGKSPTARSYTVCTYGSGQPYTCLLSC